jgi:hypothetical protein
MPKVSDSQIEKALDATGGFVSKAAKKLNVTRQCVNNRVNKNPKLKEKLMDIRESHIDFAEDKLIEAIRNNNLAAIIFFLKCQGKGRGYIEKQEIGVAYDYDARTNPNIRSNMSDIEAGRAYTEMIKKHSKS